MLVPCFGSEAGSAPAESFAFSRRACEQDFAGCGVVGEAEGFVLHHVSGLFVSIMMQSFVKEPRVGFSRSEGVRTARRACR